ncbi:MAG: nucleoside 2-deoxyribosyltransferase [Malacoplasma sp.]|nr:nucleoside 2-deoxyribosyltransferase [Malacoplasma sp.]MDE7087932.1 nucleoside 2-deoxyribosyltransferase [Malacoplasma sp.]
MKLYLAGSLFNEAEISQRKKEGTILKEKFPNLSVFNPIEQPFNTNKENLPTPIDIFNGDTKEVVNCDIFLADVTNNDPGVIMELGIAITLKIKHIICVNSDIRIKSANKYDIPTYSMNHYVLGGILKYGKLVYSFKEALSEIEKILMKK